MRGECPNRKEGCPVAREKRGCGSNSHHLYYPANRYRTSLEQQFRELPENKEQLCIWAHRELHATEFPPKKPSTDQMIQAIAQIAIEGQHEQAA